MQPFLTAQLLPSSYPDLCFSVAKGVERHDSTQDEDGDDQETPSTSSSYKIPFIVKKPAQHDVEPPSPTSSTPSPPRQPRKTRKPRPPSLFIPPPRFPLPMRFYPSLSTTCLSAVPPPFPKLSIPTAQSTASLSAVLSTTSLASVQAGPAGYAYTPTSVRVPGYESLRDDHGIEFKSKRHTVMGTLVELGVVRDEDARVGSGMRERVRDWVRGILKE